MSIYIIQIYMLISAKTTSHRTICKHHNTIKKICSLKIQQIRTVVKVECWPQIRRQKCNHVRHKFCNTSENSLLINIQYLKSERVHAEEFNQLAVAIIKFNHRFQHLRTNVISNRLQNQNANKDSRRSCNCSQMLFGAQKRPKKINSLSNVSLKIYTFIFALVHGIGLNNLR